jgi:hypothetical protein
VYDNKKSQEKLSISESEIKKNIEKGSTADFGNDVMSPGDTKPLSPIHDIPYLTTNTNGSFDLRPKGVERGPQAFRSDSRAQNEEQDDQVFLP